ncbi:MAG: formylglycine-generating enzyme family protein [Planctomycetota bacterium]|nr:formylglycine-generating enzyme family protein [Planctomycetota bacterium]
MAQSLTGASAGEVRDDNFLGLKLVWCPPGKFVMGSPPEEAGRKDHEVQAAVTLTRGFWLGKYEVTQSQYTRVMGKNTSHFCATGAGRESVQGLDTSDFPVERVSWLEAMEFCRRLTDQERLTGRLPAKWQYTLPTEAQWEYACRAGTTTAFHYGPELRDFQANFAWGFRKLAPGVFEYAGKTAAVGSFDPNPWGLCDMHGNVDEWCRDWRADIATGGLDPESTVESRWRVRRGGNWDDSSIFCRSAVRYGARPTLRFRFAGFRIARCVV